MLIRITEMRPGAANAMADAVSHVTANRTSRQSMPTKTNAGGMKARPGDKTANHPERDASASPTTANPIQYSAAMRRNMLAGPGASGSIQAQSTVITGDCQSPSTCFEISA